MRKGSSRAGETLINSLSALYRPEITDPHPLYPFSRRSMGSYAQEELHTVAEEHEEEEGESATSEGMRWVAQMTLPRVSLTLVSPPRDNNATTDMESANTGDGSPVVETAKGTKRASLEPPGAGVALLEADSTDDLTTVGKREARKPRCARVCGDLTLVHGASAA